MSFIDNVRARRDELTELRAAALDDMAAATAGAESEARSALTPEEDAAFVAARDKVDALDAEIVEADGRLADLERAEGRRIAAASASLPTVRVGNEERTYRADGDHDFLEDAFRARFDGDRAAQDRLTRARDEALVDYRSTTGNFGGLVVPQYLTERFAPVLVSGRPFLSNVTQSPLPAAGMTLTIPRGATGTSVAAQQTQNVAVSNTTYTESDLSVPVRTYAGQQVVSRQSVDRGSGIGSILLGDLFQQYATKTNVDAINGAGTAGDHYGVINTTSVQTAAWTGTTGASLVSAVHNAIGKVNTSRYAAADLIVMHPRRWAWLCAASDSNGRPLVQVDGPGYNSVGGGNAAGYGVVGSMAGVPVVSDAGVPIVLGASTDEDRIIVTRREDCLFLEDAGAPVGLTFEEVLGDTLSVRMVAFGYSAFTAGRYPAATCVLQGTGFKQVLS